VPGVSEVVLIGFSSLPIGNALEALRYSRKLWIEDFLKDVVYLPFE
jgi:hypothetical protein